jgi:hypothetical protein
MRHQGMIRSLVVVTVAVVSFVETREDLMRLIDDDKIERGRRAEQSGTPLATRKFAADQIDSWRNEVAVILTRLDGKQIREFVLPLPDQRFRHDQQDALKTFRPALGDHQPRLDRLSKPDFVSKDAAAFPKTPQRKNHRIDLVRVWVNPRLSL